LPRIRSRAARDLEELTGVSELAEVAEGLGETLHSLEGVGVILAEDPPAVGQGLLEQLVGALEVPQLSEGQGEAIHRLEGVAVAVGQHPLAGGQGLLVELVGAAKVAQGAAGLSKVAHRLEGVGVVIAELSPADGQSLLVQRPGLPVLATTPQVEACLVQQQRRRHRLHAVFLGVVGDGEGMWQQQRTCRPSPYIVAAVRERRCDQPGRRGSPTPLILGAEAVAHHGLNQAMDGQGLVSCGDEGVAEQCGDRVVECERVSGQLDQLLGLPIHQLGEQLPRDVVRSQERARL
jgi:hypothetical protein